MPSWTMCKSIYFQQNKRFKKIFKHQDSHYIMLHMKAFSGNNQIALWSAEVNYAPVQIPRWWSWVPHGAGTTS